MPGNDSLYVVEVEKQLDAPMPWIGLYVAAASSLCTLAMVVDTAHGFRGKKLWFPSKYFSLNATSLTLLAVAMKLPVDLTTRMYSATDRLAKVSSLLFLSTAVGNFMTCMGSMSDKDVVLNVAALGILVVTVMVNVCIQIIQMREFLKGRKMFGEEVVAAALMLLLLVLMASTALMVPIAKRYLESKYRETLRVASDEDVLESVEEGCFTIDRLKVMIHKYWVMAETSCPQFVIARSATCTASGVLCMLVGLVLAESWIRAVLEHREILVASSEILVASSKYGWSVKWILLSQSVGVAVGIIAPAFRWFTAIDFKYSERGDRRWRDEFRVDGHWTQKLVEWKESSLPLHIRDRRWKRLLHDTKSLLLNLAIRIQILIVLISKVVRLTSVWFISPFISCLRCCSRLLNTSQSAVSRVHGISESESELCRERDLRRYVILLEGEADLPQKILKNINMEVEKTIERGKKQKPKNLINLLHKIGSFKEVKDIDGTQVPSLHSEEPPRCWSLPLVSLTSIAIALRNAADIIWVGVELYSKWEDKDLHKTSLKRQSFKETLQELSNEAERTVMEFKRDMKDTMMENPLNWPVKVIAANSMYRVGKRILTASEGDDRQTDEGLFDQLCIMIANIMAACLTNLMHVIFVKCHRKATKEGSVQQAALLLGETEEILGILQQHRTPSLDPDESDFIAKWCNLIKQEE